MKWVYDPKHDLSYPYYVCMECGSSFYGGGPPLHTKSCLYKGLEKVEVHYGPNHNEWFGKPEVEVL